MLDVPEVYGGKGLSTLGLVVFWEQISRSSAVSSFARSIFGPEVGPVLLGLEGSLKDKYLLPVIRGEKRAAFAQTEADAGSDPGSIQTTAVLQNGKWIINGHKRFVTHGDDADFYQLVAATDKAKGSRGGLSMFLVDADTPGVRLGRMTRTIMGAVTYEITFDNVQIPEENLVGGLGKGMALAQAWISRGRLYQACHGLGVALRCIELGATFAKQRVTFGKPLADRQAVQFMLSESFMEHTLAQMVIYETAVKMDQGEDVRQLSAMAKIQGCELGFKVADRCMQIHGGMGLTDELPIARMWHQARAFRITEGPLEVMRMVVARDILARTK